MGALPESNTHQLRSFNAQDLANTAWALATLGHVDTALLRALVETATQQLRHFLSTDLTVTAWALATLGHVDTVFIRSGQHGVGAGNDGHVDAVFMGKLLKVAGPQLNSLTPQQLANMAWALGKLGHKDAAFMAALVQEAMSQLDNFKSHDLANTAWALATMGHEDAVFMGALLQSALPKLGSFNSQDLANTVWAMATLGHVDAVFVRALVRAAHPKLRSFTSQGMSDMAWSFATLGHADAAFMDALLCVATPKLLCFKPRELASMARAMAALDVRSNAACVDALIARAAGSAAVPAVAFAPAEFCQLFQFVQVLDEIRRLPGCSSASSGHLTDDGLFHIDIALQPPSGQKLAVVVDGPGHFFSNAPTCPDGATRLRNRLLEARGWRVVSVPVTEWGRQVAKGRQAAGDYLVRLGVRV
ncbi:hypothetical protein FOA52_003518 [Chlamydomonas sp. UWO 241]|nr:hypothetical protein FOA52_003518 [Chlamydomonas sp. UWO 241]